jgi:ribosomal protein S18
MDTKSTKVTGSKQLTVVRSRENQAKEEKKRIEYPYQVKVKIETVDYDGDVSISHKFLQSKVKIEKPGEYECFVYEGSMTTRDTKEHVTWCKIEALREAPSAAKK